MAILTLYRIVKTDPPTPADVESLIEEMARRNRPVPADWTEDEHQKAEGLSVYDTIEAAIATAIQLRGRRGTLIARLTLTDDSGVRCKLTGSHGHWTIWGNPDTILHAMEVVTRVPGL